VLEGAVSATRRDLIEIVRTCRAFLRTPGAVADLETAAVLLRAIDAVVARQPPRFILEERARTIRCPRCNRPATASCVNTWGKTIRSVHSARIRALIEASTSVQTGVVDVTAASNPARAEPTGAIHPPQRRRRSASDRKAA
jgi:hypothetical protein